MSDCEGRRYRPLLAAVIVDTVGEGMFMPLSFLFFLITTKLDIAAIGVGISVAAVAAMPVGIIAGPAIDRIGAKRLMVLNNLLSACGYIAYLSVNSLPLLIFAVFLVMAADRLFFASWPVLVVDISEPGKSDWLYSLISRYRNGSLAAGYLIGGAVLALAGRSDAAYVIVLLNCLSSILTAIIVGRLKPGRRTTQVTRSAPGRSRWFDVLADRPYAILTVAQSALAFAWLLPGTILPVYIVRFLGLPKWIPSALLCLNFIAVMTLQVRVTARAAKYRRTAVVGVASGILAAAVGFFALSWEVSPAGAVGIIVVGVLCFSFGEMLWNPTASALAAEAAPSDARGRYIAIFQMSWAVSDTAGPVLVGALLAAGPGWLWMSLGATIALGGVGFLLSGRFLPPAVNRVA